MASGIDTQFNSTAMVAKLPGQQQIEKDWRRLTSNDGPRSTGEKGWCKRIPSNEPSTDEKTAYWREKLRGVDSTPFPAAPTTTTTTTTTTRPDHRPTPTYAEVHGQATIPCRSTVRPSALAFASWALTVSLYTANPDACFGVQIHDPQPTVPARLLVDYASTAPAFLQLAQDDLAQTARFSNTRLEDIAGISADARRACEFSSVLVLRSAATQSTPAAAAPTITVALILECTPSPSNNNNTIATTLRFNPTILDPRFATRLLATYTHTISVLAASTPSSTPLSALSLLSPLDRTDLLDAAALASPSHAVPATAHALIAARAAQRPGAAAVDAWNGALTYGQLEERAERVAKALVRRGAIGREDAVPILCEKGMWAVVAVVGVWKAGGFYVPLDPAGPTERLRWVVREVGARVVVCSEGMRGVAEGLGFKDMVVLPLQEEKDKEGEAEGLRNDGGGVECEGAGPANLAYTMFTSGSTGTPKGVMMEHGALSSSIVALGERAKLQGGSRVLQLSALTFDISLFEIACTLAFGGCVCVPSDEQKMNGLADFINAFRINILATTPSLSRSILPDSVPSVKMVLLGGEPMLQSDKERWCRPEAPLLNAYGPTETCIACSLHPITPSTTPDAIAGVPGLRCCRLWIVGLHNENQLAPIGALGELCVEGSNVARGYLNDAARTEAMFVERPPWLPCEKPAHRVYRTGDLVRYGPDSTLRHVGRKDSQVKVRGHRVELGEIEDAIRRNIPGWMAAAVELVTPSGAGRKLLVAVFGLGRAFQTPESPEARRVMLEITSQLCPQLEHALPSYMVPDGYVPLGELPVNTSGKLDRRALRERISTLSLATIVSYSADTHGDLSATVRQPSQAAKFLRSICSTVLNTSPADLAFDRSFVRNGGDSITAMQVVARFREAGKGIKVADLLRSVSLHEAAAAVRELQQADCTLPQEQPGRRFALSPIQRVFMEFARTPEQWNHYNQSFLMRLTARASEQQLDRALASLVERHSMLRARFERAPERGEWTQYVDPAAAVPYMLNVHGAVTSAQERAALMDASRKSLDICRGRLVRVDVFDHPDDADSQLLFMVVHHLVVDLVSWRIMIDELQHILTTQPGPRELPFPFQVWAELQERRFQQDPVLGDPAAALPVAAPPPDLGFWGIDAPSNLHGDVCSRTLSLGLDLTRRALHDCHGPLHTEPIDILLAALVLSFKRVFPERDAPTIMNESHGREAWDDGIDLSRTVGWFTAVYPVHAAGIRADQVVDAVRRLKDARRSVPRNGWQYFGCRALTAGGRARFEHDLPAEVAFNHEGGYGLVEREYAVLREELWSAGEDLADASPLLPRFSLFEIASTVLAGRLHFTFVWHRAMRHQDRIMALTERVPEALEQICAALAREPAQLTRSDVPQVDADYPALAALTRSVLTLPCISSLDDVEDIFPCSPMQESLAISQARHKDTYESEMVWEVRVAAGESVSPTRLAAAWAQTVARHAVLRTVFVESVRGNGVLEQVVLRNHNPECVIVLADDAGETALKHPRREYKHDMGRPQHRMLICASDSGRAFCRLEVTHLVCDGMSISPLLRDLSLAYEGRLDTRHGPNYSEFVRYIRDEKMRKNSIAHWTDRLRDADPCFFPSMVDAAPEQDEQQEIEVRLDLSYSELQSNLSRAGLTLPTLFQTAWALTLRRYTGKDQVVFGHIVAGRDAPLAAIEDAVGLFIGVLVCRVDFSAEAPAVDTMRPIQADCIDGFAKQACSLADIHHALGLHEGTLFNSGVAFQSPAQRDPSPSSPALIFEEVSRKDPTEYDVALVVEASRQSNLQAVLQYRTSALSDDAAARVAGTVGLLVAELARDPGRRLGSIPPLSTEDHADIWRWNARLMAPADECAHHAVERSMRAHPQRPALCGWDGNLTYGELDDLSRRLAARLADACVGPERIVPLCFEKSNWAVVAMLGVLRAGGCFVMLDPTHPATRLQGIVDEVDAPVVLSSAREKARMERAGRPVIVVTPASVAALPPVGLDAPPACPDVAPDHAMYAVFTSGTTGVPKGAVISHRAFCSGFREHARAMCMSAATRTLQFAAYSFDASIVDIMCTLRVGGVLCTPSHVDRTNIAPFIRRSGANWAGWTPSFAAAVDPRAVPTLEVLVLAGEPLPRALVDAWASHVKLLNVYGPSECSVACTVNAAIGGRGANPANIGRAYRAATWIVDESDHERLRPVGAVGELLIEGPALARGYLNRPVQTAEVFIDAPSWLRAGPYARPGSRLYKTGDLVRYSSDGSIVFIGRKDMQLKINGQRVEVGDIEHHLREALLPSTLPVIVELLKREPADLLVAFVVMGPEDCSQQQSGEPEDIIADNPRALETFRALTAQVREAPLALPAYMMPKAFVPLKMLPITTAGKQDRRALQRVTSKLSREELLAFSASSSSSATAARAVEQGSRTPEERELAGLWKHVLHTESAVAAHDNFFHLGGDSLLAIRLSAAARQRHGFRLTVADIFARPVLADMAAHVAGTAPADDLSHDVADVAPFSLLDDFGAAEMLRIAVAEECGVEVEDVEDVFPCTPLQEALMAISAKEYYAQAYSMHAPFRLPHDLDEQRFRTAWETTCAQHSMLRARIILRPQGALQVIVRTPVVVDTVTAPLGEYLKRQQSTPFEYGQPLLRLAIVGASSGGGKHFVISVNHACYDGWSQRLVWEFAACCYRGEQTPPPPPFQAFVRQMMSTPRSVSEQFWRAALADHEEDDSSAATAFPAIPAGHKPLARSKLSHACTLPPKPSHHPDVTLSTLLNAAWALVIAQYSGSASATFGVTVSGREVALPGIEAVVGPTLATIPRKVGMNGGQSVKDFLQHVHADVVVASIPHAHVALDRIMRLSPAARRACNFGSLLTVQPRRAVLGTAAHKAFGVVVESVDTSGFHPYPLIVDCWLDDEEGGLELEVQFDPECVAPAVAEGLARQFDHVLQRLCAAEPGAPLKLAMTLRPDDLAHILAWNGRELRALEACAHRAIEANAEAHPYREALVTTAKTWTYAELDRDATKLGRRLRMTGRVGPDRFVGLCFEKTGFAVVAMLAVWKAGGAYLPLNPAHPPARLRSLLDRASAEVVLTSSMSREAVAGMESCLVVCVDEGCSSNEEVEWGEDYETVKPRASSPDHAAYMIYTSGSTGEPKGVVIEHRALCSSIAAMQSTVTLAPDVRMLQYASFTFDVSVEEIFVTLTAGACVCMPSDSERANDIAAFVRTHGVNAINLTPSVLRLLRPADVSAVRLVVCGGEALAQSDVETWANVPDLRLVNEYGPTEVCICITRALMTPGTKASNIGVPSAMLPWVVSPATGGLAPVGGAGELFLQGPNMARGYHADPERTAAAFLWNPEWLPEGFGGSRVYRTGDMVARNADGTLTFLGRRDGQVKIRGQRVEMGEVADRVRKAVAELGAGGEGFAFVNVAVELYRAADGSKREPFLVVLLALGNLPTEGDELLVMHSSDNARLARLADRLKHKLRSMLPDYMVPPAYVAMRALPVTLSGKLNRRLIHLQLEELERQEQPLVGARTSRKGDAEGLSNEEEMLRQCWAEVLGIDIEAIGRDDGFFDLGGSSVTGIRLVSLVRARGRRLKYEDLATAQRLDEMALRLAQAREADDELLLDPAPFELLRPEQRERVLHDLPRHGIDPAQVEDVYPCTPLQESFIAATVRDPEAYVSFHAIDVVTADETRFQAAWNAVVARFELLRTRIVPGVHDGPALQVVMQPPSTTEPSQPWLRVRNLSEFIATVRATPCHGGELARMAWLSDAPPPDNSGSAARAILAAHHALYDGASMSMIWRALEAELAGKVTTTTTTTTTTPVPFRAFIKRLANQNKNDAAAQHWRARLTDWDNPPFPLTVPPPPGHQITASRTVSTTAALGARARAGASALARAAWGLALSSYAGGASDVSFGSVVSGREGGGGTLEAVGGPTMAAVPVRVRLDYADGVDALLARVAREAAADLPFAQWGLHRIARVSEDARRVCGFATVLAVQPPPEEEGQHKLRPEPLASPRIFPHAVILEVVPSADACRAAVSLAYDPVLLPDALARRVLDTFAALLARLSDPANGGTQLAALPAISPADRADLQTWARAAPPVVVDRCVHELVADSTARTPGAVAIDAWDGILSYGQLDKLADSLAAHLVTLGVQRESAVPLLFDKSKWMPVTMLAVWKAGGLCVLLDAGWPLARMKAIVEAVDAVVIVASAGIKSVAESVAGCADRVVVAEHGAPALYARCSTAGSSARDIASPSDLAYVMFTSGSTGTPKGVMLPHRALSSSIEALRLSHGIDASARVLHAASYSFDASLCELFVALAAGATACVPSESARADNLGGYMRDARVSHSFCTPSLSRVLDPHALPDLRALFLGGEPMLDEDMRRWYGRVFLTNGFGPTEACIACAVQSLTSLSTSARSIGKALQSCRLWVVAPAAKGDALAPVGAVGELCIEGPSVAMGYLDDPEKTAGAFMDAPPEGWFGEECAEVKFRVYRTGDLVRYDEHGALRFVGRKDTLQVKLRGQRIELGEVENAVRSVISETYDDNFSRVTAVAVDVFEGRAGKRMLLAVLAIGDTYQEDEKGRPHPSSVAFMRKLTTRLRARLDAALPRHMIPDSYVPIKKLPLSAAGKLDRRRLRACISKLSLSQVRAFSAAVEGGIVAELPHSEEEKLLSRLWAKVLGLPEGAELTCADSFFGLGGDSILAMRLVAETRQHGFDLTVRDIFAESTLGATASRMKRLSEDIEVCVLVDAQAQGDEREGEALEIVRNEYPEMPVVQEEGAAPCTPSQVTMIERGHVVCFVFTLEDAFDLPRFRAAIERCAAHLTILRTRIVRAGGELRQVVVSDGPPWRFADACLEQAMEEEANVPIGFGQPLTRFTVAGKGSHLIWTQHHAIYDAWAMKLLLQHVVQTYRDPIYQPFERLSFHTFSRRLHRSSCPGSPALSTFWSSYFESATPTPQLFRYASINDPRLDTSASHKININQQLLSSAAFTPAEAIIAAWILAVGHLTGSRDVTIGYLVNGRTVPSNLFRDIESTVGPTINTVPLRVRLDDSDEDDHQQTPSIRAVATRIHGQLLRLASARQLDGLESVRAGCPAAAACLPAHLFLFSLNLILHTGGNQSEVVLSEAGRALGLRHQEAQAVAAPAGGFTVEATVSGGAGGAVEAEACAFWDGRVVDKGEVEEVFEFVSRALSGVGGTEWGGIEIDKRDK